MLLVVTGAGASYDSIMSRRVGAWHDEEARLPLADSLFAPRPLYEDIQRKLPRVMQVATHLMARPRGASVEELLAEFVTEVSTHPARFAQLAAIRFYLQALISLSEERWYRAAPVATNVLALLDRIENARNGRAHPLFVTFNYDRMLEHALEVGGQKFNDITQYVGAGKVPVVKLHGSVDWARPLARFDTTRFPSQSWELATAICEHLDGFPAPGPIEKRFSTPLVRSGDMMTVPAIAIPVRVKDRFECPPEHLAFLDARIAHVQAILTIGWRGQEEHFLQLLGARLRHHVQVICVGGSNEDAEATIANMQRFITRAHWEPFGGGFSEFLRHERVERLLRICWISSSALNSREHR